MTMPLRSVLFVPAVRPGALRRMRTLDCDALILDLEDSVAPDRKSEARAAAVGEVAAGGFGRRVVAIRVNGLGSEHAEADFAAARDTAVDVIVVPKVESAEQASQAVSAAGGKPVWTMVETPLGILRAEDIAAVPGVAGLVAGHADLAKDLRATPDRQRTELGFALHRLLYAARAFGRIALDGVHGDVADLEGLALTCRQGAALGYDGRTLIHPDHIAVANAAYAPDAERIANAHELIAAHEAALAAGAGVTTYRGQLVEALHVAEARRLIAFAEAIARAD